MDNKILVKKWLEKCDKQGIKPWEYDFKQEVFIQKSWSPTFDDNPIQRILKKDCCLYGNPNCETEDSMLAQAIYHILWGTYSKNALQEERGNCDADVMNSFWMILKNCILVKTPDFFAEVNINRRENHKYPARSGTFKKGDELFKYYKEHDYSIEEGDTWSTLILKNFGTEFDKPDYESLRKMALLTHTIGNFTLEPKGFNASGVDGKKIKHNDFIHTWSQALYTLKKLDWVTNKYLDCSSWEKYCEKFFMEDYVENNSRGYCYEKGLKKQDEFLEKINESIEKRGKRITKKLCDELQSRDLNIYKKFTKIET